MVLSPLRKQGDVSNVPTAPTTVLLQVSSAPPTATTSHAQGTSTSPTATSLLPLRCFQVVHIPRIRAKFSHQGRVGLASAKPDPPSGAKRGETPSASKFSSKKDLFLAEFLSCFLTTSKSGSWKRRSTRKQPRLTEPRDSYASEIRIPHSSPLPGVTHAW